MIIVPVKDGDNIEKSIKRFKRKFDKIGVGKEVRRRQAYAKPSEKRRAEIVHATYVQQLRAKDED